MSAGAPAGRTIVLALGSNLGDRLAHLQRGIDLLGAAAPEGGLRVTAVSGVYETAPVGGPPQDDYLNAVLLAVSALPCLEILRRCQAAEAALGRVRVERWGPRTLDVDVVTCGDELSADSRLTLPHPRAGERAFVLMPWLDVAPDAVLPGGGRVADLLAVVGTAGVRRWPDVTLTMPAADQAVAGQPVAGQPAPDQAAPDQAGKAAG